MDLAVTAALVAAAFAAGTVDAIAGGGGLVTLPALLAAGLPVPLALGTNKGQSTFGSLSALVSFWRLGAIDRSRVAVSFGFAFVGSLLGASLVAWGVPRRFLRPMVLVLLVVVALVLTLRRDVARPTEPLPPDASPPRRAALIALVIGAYDGFFGPGTGTFVILSYVTWLREAMARASANAKVVNFASNLAALTIFTVHGDVRWRVALPMAAAQFLGGAFGARLAVKRGDRFVRWVVLGVVLCLVVKIAVDLGRG
jgi:uncharacterized membrane protein YfcA